MEQSFKFFLGMIYRPQDVLIKLPKDKVLFSGLFVFIFEELVNFVKNFFTDAHDVAISVGDTALADAIKNLPAEEFTKVNQDIHSFFITSSVKRILVGVAIFFVAPYFIKLVVKYFKRDIGYMKTANIFGFSFVPQFLFIILLLALAQFGISEGSNTAIRVISYLITIYTFALIGAGVYLCSDARDLDKN